MRILRNTDSKCILLEDLTFTYTVIILKTVYIQVQEYSKRNRKGALHIKVSPTQRHKEIWFSKSQRHAKESRVKLDHSHWNSLSHMFM